MKRMTANITNTKIIFYIIRIKENNTMTKYELKMIDEINKKIIYFLFFVCFY